MESRYNRPALRAEYTAGRTRIENTGGKLAHKERVAQNW